MPIRTLLVSGCCFALVLLLSCRKDTLSPNAITAIEYTISGGIMGRHTSLSITPQQQSLTTNVRFNNNPARQGACEIDVAISPQEWQTLTGTYNDAVFKNVPKSKLPDCCDLIYSTITVKAGDVTRQASVDPLIQPFVDALSRQLTSLEARCP